VKEVEKSKIVFARCPKCDGCALCEALYDDKGDLVPLKTARSNSVVDGELVNTYRKICEACVLTEKARKLGFVVEDDPMD
jgi:hypothetical protein